MEETIIQEVQKFGVLINWSFTFTFLMIAYTVKKIIKTKTISKFQSTQTWKVSIIIGVILITLFFLLNGVYSFKEFLRYIISMAFTMFVMWDGLKKWDSIFNKKKNGKFN